MAEPPEVFALRGARIFVAGHRGMVGAACVRRLQAEGCDIVTADRAQLDLRRQAEVEAFMAAARPDAVIVAAAKVGGILANDTLPAEFLYDNLMIEANLIEAAHRAGVNRLLFLGSSCIYPREAPNPIPEDMLRAWTQAMVQLEPWIEERAREAGARYIKGTGFSEREVVREFPELGAEEAVAYTATILPIPSGVWLAFKANVERRPRICVQHDTRLVDLVQDPDTLDRVVAGTRKQCGDSRSQVAKFLVRIVCTSDNECRQGRVVQIMPVEGQG